MLRNIYRNYYIWISRVFLGIICKWLKLLNNFELLDIIFFIFNFYLWLLIFICGISGTSITYFKILTDYFFISWKSNRLDSV